MRAARRKGLTYSAILHLVLLAFIIFGLPELIPPPLEEPAAITVEILPITGVTNVRPSAPQSAEEKPKASTPVKTAEAVPLPPPPKPAEIPKKEEKKPEPKKEEKKPEPKKEEKKKTDDNFEKLMHSLDNTQKEKKPDTKPAHSNSYNPELPLSLDEKSAIISQIVTQVSHCWSELAGAKNAKELVPVLRIQLNPDGSLISVTMTDDTKARYNGDSFYQAATDHAIRAVKECSPIKNLPADKYEIWKDLELEFSPDNL